MKNPHIYEEVNDMRPEEIFGLIFIATAIFGRLIVTAIHYGAFDVIAIKLTNYIVSRMERNEGKDI